MNLFDDMNYQASRFEGKSANANRLIALGFLTEMDEIIMDLGNISADISNVITVEDANLSKDLINKLKLDSCSTALLEKKLHHNEPGVELIDRRHIDIIGHGNTDKSRKEVIDQMKSDISGVCNTNIVLNEEIAKSFIYGIGEINRVLEEILKKKKSIKDVQYKNFWCKYKRENKAMIAKQAANDYEEWKSEHNVNDMQVLADKQTQEILKVIKSGVFSYDNKPTKREIRNCCITISEDALEEDTVMPERIHEMRAQMSRYAEMKGGVLVFDYAKLGRYLYTHCPMISFEQVASLIYFDNMMGHLYKDMVNADPHLKKYLKSLEYDGNEEDIKFIIKHTKNLVGYLADGVPQDFLESYFRSAYAGDIKYEIRSKMEKESSRYKLTGMMIGMLKSSQKVFKSTTTLAEIARILHQADKASGKRAEITWKRYVERGAIDWDSDIAKWTSNYIKKKLVKAK